MFRAAGSHTDSISDTFDFQKSGAIKWCASVEAFSQMLTAHFISFSCKVRISIFFIFIFNNIF
jgi:hypothetical protein